MLDLAPVSFGRDARRLKLDTLVRLRWLAVTGQTTAVAVVHLPLGYKLPFGLCLAVIAAAVALNLWLRARFPASHRLSDGAATALLAFDILQLALLLYLTGGLQNPFSMLFVAPVLISATALTPRRTLALGSLVVACASVLAFVHMRLPWSGEAMKFPSLYVAGIWLAILLCTAFTGVFAYLVAEEARQLAEALAATEFVLAREQHLSQLDGLAAAAAHELGTPLATIRLVAKELDLQAPAGSAMAEDTKLLREEVERCRLILSKLTSLNSEEGGFFSTMSLGQLIEEVAGPQRSFEIDIRVTRDGEGAEPSCQRSPGLIYGLANLIDNAVDFAVAVIRIDARWDPSEVSVTIQDDGPGFAPEVLLRVGEPYITTRGKGRDKDKVGSGLGLGLFIAKTLIERSGAQLFLSNVPGPATGAVVRVVWPRHTFERNPDYISVTELERPMTEHDVAPI